MEGKIFEKTLREKLVIAGGCLILSPWSLVKCGVPQGSVLGPTLFNIFINDLPYNIDSKLILYADDTTALIEGHNDEDVLRRSERVLCQLQEWFKSNALKLNSSKTSFMKFSTNGHNTGFHKLVLGVGVEYEAVSSTRFLGVNLQNSLKWDQQVKDLIGGLSRALFALRTVASVANQKTALKVYHGCFLSLIRYSVMFWGGCVTDLHEIFLIQKKAVRVLGGFNPFGHDTCRPLFRNLKLLTVPAIYFLEVVLFVVRNDKRFELDRAHHSYGTRHKSSLLYYPAHKTSAFEKGPYYSGIRFFNQLPTSLKQFNSKALSKILTQRFIEGCPYTMEECSMIAKLEY